MVTKVLCLIQLATLNFLQVYTHTLYGGHSHTRFTYSPDRRDPFGVYNWKYTYQDKCGGSEQSPINIQTDKLRYRSDFQCPRMLYTSRVLKGQLKNNGHSATFEPDSRMRVRLINVPNRPGLYKLHDFHFHMGGLKSRQVFEHQGKKVRGPGGMYPGSEHTVDGLRYAGEVHFVFYNSKYGDLDEAEHQPDGLVVLGFLVQKVDDYLVDSTSTHTFSKFLDRNIPKVAKVEQNISTEVDLSIFLGRSCDFFTYFGSTTTPLCHESVQWVLFREPIQVTERAWSRFTKFACYGDFDKLFGNYRNLQPLNNRVIESNFNTPYLVPSELELPAFPQPPSFEAPIGFHVQPVQRLPVHSRGIYRRPRTRQTRRRGHFMGGNRRLHPSEFWREKYYGWDMGLIK